MRQRTVKQLIAAAAMLNDEQKQQLANGEAVEVTIKNTSKLPIEATPRFDGGRVHILFRKVGD